MTDLSRKEKFRSLTASYYRGTHGIVVVFDVSDRQSFENVDTWLSEAQLYAVKCDPVILLIGNKIDKPERAVTKKEATDYARDKGMVYIETSAKTKVGIQQTFEELVQKILDKGNYAPEAKSNTVQPGYESNNTQESDWGCC
jgi:Ras-related protein Rab-18